MYQQKNNVTYISDLPDLNDLEGGQNIPQPNIQAHQVPPKYQKFIRNSHKAPSMAGMVPQEYPQPNPMNHFMVEVEEQDEVEEIPYKHTISCIEIAEHISHCPICIKFYNNDKTIYIIAIIMLSLICILLLKKVLDL